MLYSIFLLALLAIGAAAKPTKHHCKGSGCGGVCGDAIVQAPDEQCDLGFKLNGAPNSGCTADCKTAPVCGNGVVEEGEECDAGPWNGAYNSGCASNCTLCGYCGDGILQAGEQCDLGSELNGTPGASCSATCTTNNVPVGRCGDGIVQPGEQCDDGQERNGFDGWRCNKDCQWTTEPVCGNGITERPEECDDGDLNGSPASQCTKDCTLKEPCGKPNPAVCGNGIIEFPDEECDEGYLNGQPGSRCTSDCKKRKCRSKDCNGTTDPPRCGDGKVDAANGEECDEGDANNGRDWSLCDASCRKKTPGGGGQCETCNPNPFFNKCTITTSCITTPSSAHYCACRAGYRASGLLPTDPRQFRLPFPGQEYRVFVAPGVECDQLCSNPHPGPDSCQEVPVQEDC